MGINKNRTQLTVFGFRVFEVLNFSEANYRKQGTTKGCHILETTVICIIKTVIIYEFNYL